MSAGWNNSLLQLVKVYDGTTAGVLSKEGNNTSHFHFRPVRRQSFDILSKCTHLHEA